MRPMVLPDRTVYIPVDYSHEVQRATPGRAELTVWGKTRNRSNQDLSNGYDFIIDDIIKLNGNQTQLLQSIVKVS